MSSAFYPLGMKSYNNHVRQGGYKSWKGDGINSNPVGITSGTIRPLTNNDPTNNSDPGFGLPRPIKHARKGRGFDYTVMVGAEEVIVNRANKSSTGGSLVKQMVDIPGGYCVSQNTPEEVSNVDKLDADCTTCRGIGIVESYYPNNSYLTENPESITQTKQFCCNAEQKARRRAIYASTNIKKNYYTTLQQYRENRCLTYDQRAFNFATTGSSNRDVDAKPGGPLAMQNTYLANCQPNDEFDENGEPLIIRSGCKPVVYKPNNYKYAQQGAVSSSTRLLRLNVETINRSSNNGALKNKVPKLCNPPVRQFQNKLACGSQK